MSADMETTTDATEHHPIILPETWRQIFALVELAADPKGFKRRLHGLANALSAVDAATRKLAAERLAFDAYKAKETAELEERREIGRVRLGNREKCWNARLPIGSRPSAGSKRHGVAYGCRASRLRCLAPSAGRRHSPDLR